MPERAEKRKKTSIIIILAAALVLVLCICIAMGGLLAFGATQVADIFDQDKPQHKVVVEIPRRMEELERPLARPTGAGALITEVIPGSPAARAGLQPNDVIVAVDGQRVGPNNTLAQVIGQYEPGDRVRLQVERPGGGSQEIVVKLGKNPDRKGMAYLGVGYASLPELGIRLEEVLPHGHMEGFYEMPFTLPPGGRLAGVIIQEVIAGGPAADANLQAGDFLETLNGEQVENSEAFAAAIGSHRPGDRVTLGVRDLQSGDQRQVTVRLAAHPDDPAKGYLGVTIGGAMHMEGIWPEGSAPGEFRFFYRGPGEHGMPFDLEELPIDPDAMPFFHREDLPFDPDDMPFFHREDMPFDPDDMPFFHREDMPFHHDDADKDLEKVPDDTSA